MHAKGPENKVDVGVRGAEKTPGHWCAVSA